MEVRTDTYLYQALRLANEDDYDTVMKIYKKYPKFFAHVRTDYVKEKIKKGELIFQDGVLLAFLRYKRKTHIGDMYIYPGTYGIKQIATDVQGNGEARKILKEFLKLFGQYGIVLTVREDNIRAVRFYGDNGFYVAGKIQWGKGIPGLIMKYTG